MNLLCATYHEIDQLRITTALLYKKQTEDNAFKKNKNRKNIYACKLVTEYKIDHQYTVLKR